MTRAVAFSDPAVVRLVSTRFSPVRLNFCARGPAPLSPEDSAVVEALEMRDPARVPSVPDLLVLDGAGAVLARESSFAEAGRVVDFLAAALVAAGQPAPPDRWSLYGDDDASRELAELARRIEGGELGDIPARQALIEAWLTRREGSALAPLARVLLGDALALAGEGQAAIEVWRGVLRDAPEHFARHRAHYNLLNHDIWPVPIHPALSGAPPLPEQVPSPPPVSLRERALSDARYRWSPSGLPFAPIPAGSFVIGADAPSFPREGPRRRVHLSRSFWMAAWPVTRALYALFDDRRFPDVSGPAGLYPALGISWDEAVAFADFLSRRDGWRYRLPTEAEWVRAARGGLDGATYPWGEEPPDPSRANYHLPGVVPVASYPPNGYGLFDVLGNGMEWVQDVFDASWLATLEDGAVDPVNLPEPVPPGAQRVTRSMFPAPVELIRSVCRIDARSYAEPSRSFGGRGFRLVAEGVR